MTTSNSSTKPTKQIATQKDASKKIATKEKKQTPDKNKDSWRETIESVVVAFVLAFLFRAFEAEAFVIPTGSMAPTLFGRHKDVTCDKCGYEFPVGASDEVDNAGYLKSNSHRLMTTICPNCRHEMRIKDLPVFKGDRILVNKYPYEFADPKRWDVVVFKYPEESKTNYIKRLVGLPGDHLRIEQGDIYKKNEAGEWRIVRKDNAYKQRAIQLPVHDNDYSPRELREHGWPSRWAAVEKTRTATGIDGWEEDAKGWREIIEENAFQIDSTVAKNKLAWLRYRHIVPTSQVWNAIEDSDFEAFDLRPKLITDFCGYNCYTGGDSGSLSRDFYWVPDLTISCEVETSDLGTNPELVFEVTRGVRKFRCRFNLETGVASIVRVIDISRDEEEEVMATAKTKVKGARSVRIRFANVDQRLCLWVNGTLVDFGSGAEYHLPQTFNRSPQDADLTPIGIAAQNATVKVSHLLIERDIYYRSEQLDAVSGTYKFECDQETRRRGSDDDHYARLQRSPARWWEMYAACQNTAEFELGEDEFLMLGDNSPRSKDSRLWSNERQAVHRHAVPRSALVGKAFFIYWPHGIPFFNDGNGFSLKEHSRYANDPKLEKSYPEYRIPFYPHFSRMRRIR